MAKITRNLFTVKSRSQLKYTLLLLFSMLVPTIFVGACMYYFISVIATGGITTGESILNNLFPLLKKINLIMSVGLFLIFVVFLMIGCCISHGLIGPLSRLRKELKQITDGDMHHRIKTRKGDDLSFIAEAVNQILDKK